ncbi:ExbD/TolR family protein [Parapedobacter koreensis]|uniref:Biopolymer transport protein ExbD n=1 Tax=Parapedobacter koreensis TaxID=332977 RepID=A0A1H7PYP8_9SPHI|nr:biopolymer transporter ExbD [Parapedobacter koreensis]SEL40564.1 Biopolymer transport protein ExbD [Parapedobacter koreensis]
MEITFHFHHTDINLIIMAELNTGRRLQPRVDLTAMVDLAFLLITFFMLTTNINKQQALDVAMPDITDTSDFSPLADNRTVTLLLGEGKRVDWYWGLLDKPLAGPHSTVMGKDGIRTILLEKKNEIAQITGEQGKGMIVVIRPSDRSAYASLVDALDEMKICGIRQYMIGKISPAEEAVIGMKTGN